MKRPRVPFGPGGFRLSKKATSFPTGGIARHAGFDCLCKSRPTWRVSPHRKAPVGGRSGRVGKTPQAHTGRKMSFSRRMSPKMTEFLFLPPSPHWIDFEMICGLQPGGCGGRNSVKPLFPVTFFFRHAGAGSAQQIVPPRKRAADPGPDRRPQRDNSCTSVCRYAGLRPAVRECDGFRVPVRGYARLCAAVRRRAGTQPLLGTCRVFVPSPLSMPGFRPVISMPGFRPVILRRRSRRRIFFPVPLTGGGRKKILRCAQDDMGKVQDNRGEVRDRPVCMSLPAGMPVPAPPSASVDGFRVPVRGYARLCAAVRRRAGTQPLLGTCRVFVPSPLSMPGLRPVILRRRSRRRIFSPFL